MKKNVVIFSLFIFALLILPRDVLAGPFGFQVGMTIDEIKRVIGKGSVTKGDVNIYISTKAPKGHSLFESFLLTIDPTKGLVRLEAYSSTIVTSVYGRELKLMYSEIEEALTNNYGNCTSSYDFLRVGSIWREPREFMMALLKKERFLAAYWEGDLKDDITNILLEGRALSRNTANVYVSYEFVGFYEYIKKQTEEEQKGF